MTAKGNYYMKINFTKMHGLGNDFILIDCIVQKFKVKSEELKVLSKNSATGGSA